jgi:tetratricopeptide (TPR) repeat protein
MTLLESVARQSRPTVKTIDQAMTSFETAMFLDPYWAYPRYNLALAYQIKGEDAQARKAYQEAIDFARYYDMSAGYLHHNLGVMLQREQEWQSAEEAFRAAITSFSHERAFIDTFIHKVASEADGAKDRAAWAQQRQPDLARDEAEAHNSLGTLYAVQGSYAKATREFLTALNILPKPEPATNPAKRPNPESAARNLGVLLVQKQRAGPCQSLPVWVQSTENAERLLETLGWIVVGLAGAEVRVETKLREEVENDSCLASVLEQESAALKGRHR